ncbi:MAG: endolytic transglycosylase MltG [Burkholderiales bacterium]|nr:endolytic transglycosylase MltG [Burkholderiales bacterium]MDP2398758.1 endolytic transglycosylase MltG [Burkholderiales bacterium]
MHSKIRLLKFLFGSALLAVIVAAAALFYYAHRDLDLGAAPVSFELRSGSSLRSVAIQLAATGVIGRPEPFELMARLRGESTKLKAGNYELSGRLSPLALLDRMTRGDVTLVSVTFVEGWTFRQMLKTLQDHPKVKAESPALSEAEILQRLDIEKPYAEGWFFPDTYHFSEGASDLAILRRAHQLMLRHLDQEWERRVPGLPLKSPEEALILASIVEKETGRPEERALVAAVFINRLRIGMRLQTDPTVIYGMGAAFDGNIRRSDLTTDTPYNTYTRAGLPPTPIALPGLDSLRATLNPASSNAMYFVARGDGTSKFSRTLAEHERAVDMYQRRGRPRQ